MRRITKIEIFTIIIILISAFLYFYPKMFVKKDIRNNALIKAHTANLTMVVLEHFSQKKPEDVDFEYVAKSSTERLNKINKNPIDKKNKAFTYDFVCKGCVNVTINNETKTITLTGYDKNLEIVSKTVIKPPSYITYDNKDLTK